MQFLKDLLASTYGLVINNIHTIFLFVIVLFGGMLAIKILEISK